MEDLARKRRTEDNRRTIAGGSRIRWEVAAADDDHSAWSKQSKTAPQSEFCDARKKPELEMKRQRKRSWRVNGGIFLML